ncbi:MAG TPA: response regulator [Sphingomonadaceae bacterium]|nr:response regulator [Sphingomonadaceae bacterium]
MSEAADMARVGSGRRVGELLAVAAAFAASVALVWFATREQALTLTFAGGLVALGAVSITLLRNRPAAGVQTLSIPDWTVTVAAIEQAGLAIAITDRANRLVCANSFFVESFGGVHAPPGLPLSDGEVEVLTRAGRAAWRDGSGGVDLLERDGERWRIAVERAGRADEYLIWRFSRLVESDPLATIAERISGSFGRILAQAGIDAVLVGPEGVIRAASPGFSARAAGDEGATLVGQEFATQLRSDERERIYYTREGRKGSPVMLVQVPLVEPDDRDLSPEHASSLMLLLDSGVGIGANWGAEPPGSPAQLQALLEQLPVGLAMADRDGHLLFSNPAFLRACGLEGKSLPPFPSDLVVKEDKAALSDAVRRHGHGPLNTTDIAVRLRANPDEPVSLGLAGVRGMGEPAVLLSLADTTEEARLKRQVAQQTKMQAVGQLAGGVAHDFNNVLTAIIGYCDLMLLRHTPGDSDYDDIQQIRANSNRAASLTRQLLAFSRQQTLRPEILQVPDVVSEVSQLLKRLMGDRIEFKVHHDRNLGPVRADPQQLEQVIVNLAVNARDAMLARGETGRLSMATRRITSADIRRLKSDIIPIGDYTALIVEDTGGGIPAEHLGKIFEPFFTTKEMGKGTGLGLSTVYGIVKQSGGFIFADNVEGKNGAAIGARFTIYLPVHHAAAAAPVEPAARDTSSWPGGGKLLLVEDEDMVRAVAERALARAGYDVTTASDGEEGLERIADSGPFDLVVSDVVMPGMDGPAMARELRKSHPALPVLFMSGYAEEQLRNEIDIDAMHFIPKPFSVQQISDKVAEVLGASKK